MIPQRPMNFRAADLTIDDMIDLGAMLSNLTPDNLPFLKRVLTEASDWTAAEVGKIKMSELTEVVKRMEGAKRAEESAAVPPVTGDSSPDGQSTVRGESPSGSSS